MRLIDADKTVEYLYAYLKKIDNHSINTVSKFGKDMFEITKHAIQGCINIINCTPTASQWIPMLKKPPEIGQYVLISTDMNFVATAVFQGDYWESTFDLDWIEVLAWMPSPKPYETKE